MKKLSKMTENFTESVIREMTRVCNAANGLNLSQGFPDFECPKELKIAAANAINENRNQYPITFGEPKLREAVSMKAKKYNKITADPNTEITITCGATEAMIAALKALINNGDEIIIFEPFYENYGPDAIMSGAIPKFVRLNAPETASGEWEIDFSMLENAFNENTKAIIINTPNNPTGKVFSREELQTIADLCIKWDVYAITDEIYENIVYDGYEHVSIASLPGMEERTITINSISKTYSVTGWRVGWAIANSRITERIRKVHDFLTVGAPTPFQHAAVAALNLPDQYYTGLQKKYAERREILFETLSAKGFAPYYPHGSYYMMVNIAHLRDVFGVDNDYDFALKLIEKTGIATVPGFSFYAKPEDGRDYVRFAFCKNLDTLEKIKARLDRLNQ